MCKDGREEKIAKFDGDTIRKETVFRNVSIVDNLKATSEGSWFGGKKNRVTRTDKRVENTEEQRVVVTVPQFGRKLMRRPSVFSKYIDAQR